MLKTIALAIVLTVSSCSPRLTHHGKKPKVYKPYQRGMTDNQIRILCVIGMISIMYFDGAFER